MVEKIVTHIINVLKNACLLFTLIAMVIATPARFIIGSQSSNFLFIITFCIIFSLSGYIFKIRSLPNATLVIFHFLSTYAAFALIFLILGQMISSSRSIIFLSFAYAAVYAVGGGLYLLLKKLIFGKKKDNGEYISQFEKIGK